MTSRLSWPELSLLYNNDKDVSICRYRIGLLTPICRYCIGLLTPICRYCIGPLTPICRYPTIFKKCFKWSKTWKNWNIFFTQNYISQCCWWVILLVQTMKLVLLVFKYWYWHLWLILQTPLSILYQYCWYFQRRKNDTLEKYETPNTTFRCPKVIRSYGYIIISIGSFNIHSFSIFDFNEIRERAKHIISLNCVISIRYIIVQTLYY